MTTPIPGGIGLRICSFIYWLCIWF